MADIRININGREILAQPDQYILQAALANGIEIPHLCHDDRIKPFGACGLCVVEIEGNPKLQRACATTVADGMVIQTHTHRTATTRKAALKLLLSDHRGDCRPPCTLACPAQTDCQGYVGLIANGQYREAAELVKETNPLPASIGKVCPHPCETACRRQLVEEPISIAALKTFAGERALEQGGLLPEQKAPTGKSVAIVGAGPAGISCAFFLAKEGHQVTIYEAMPQAGGMLRYGIPQYRLPKDLLDAEIDLIRKMGVEIKYNSRVGKDITLDFLKTANNAVFLAIGAWESQPLRCKGQDMSGVMGGIDFLRQVTLNEQVDLGKKVLVIGGGNTAMDVARTAVRLGAAEVTVIYRRTREEMPAEDIEIEEAHEEGVKFIYLAAPLEVIGNGGKAAALRCQKMKLGAPDASGRRSPEPIPGKEITLEADTIISATGQGVNARDMAGLNLSKSGTVIVIEDSFETNIPGVFAGGEAVTGSKIAIQAIAQGRQAAGVIASYLQGNLVSHKELAYCRQEDLTAADFADRDKQKRVALKFQDAQTRKRDFSEIASTMSEAEAKKEAARCLECGCRDYFECQLLKYVHEYELDTENRIGEKHKWNVQDEHPFLERNPDKCILCGLCVRVCDETMGITALGLVGRGFDTIVRPEFGLPLKETDCISCGQCASLCPTGALMEKEAIVKQVPVDLEETPSVCGFCGVGCSLVLKGKGDLVYRALPDAAAEEGLLCARGRFGLWHINQEDRLKKPLLKSGTDMKEASWPDAALQIIKRLQAVRAVYGPDSIAVAVSPRMTNEEAYLVKKIAARIGTGIVGSFSHAAPSGLSEITGRDASTVDYAQIASAQMILAVGNIAENHPIMGIKLKNAAAKAKLIVLSPEKTQAAQWAALSAVPGEGFFTGLLKAFLDLGKTDEAQIAAVADGYAQLQEYVKNAAVTEPMRQIAQALSEAKKAVIVIDEDSTAPATIQLLANLAVISGMIGKPQRGLIIVRSKNNTQGLLDLGLGKTGAELTALLEKGSVKALVVLGENPVAIDKRLAKAISKLEYLMVGDIFKTKTTAMADAILPLVSFAETSGTFIRSDGKPQTVCPAIKPLTGKDNLDVLLEIARQLGLEYKDIAGIRNEIALTLYEEQSAKVKQGKYKLTIPMPGPAFRKKATADTIELSFADFCRSTTINTGMI